jgi:hypothetical protein
MKQSTVLKCVPLKAHHAVPAIPGTGRGFFAFSGSSTANRSWLPRLVAGEDGATYRLHSVVLRDPGDASRGLPPALHTEEMT